MAVNAEALSITIDPLFFVGQDITFDWRVIRSVDLLFDPFQSYTYLAEILDDNSQLIGDTLINSVPFQPGFSANSFISEGSGTFNDKLTNAGEYSVTIYLDPFDDVLESNENDNSATASFSVRDAVFFELNSFSVFSLTDIAGGSWNFGFSVDNTLSQYGQDLSNYVIRVVASEDGVFDGSDLVLGDYTIGSDFSTADQSVYSTELLVDIPENLATGSYQIGLIFDPDNAFSEAYEGKTESVVQVNVIDPLVDFTISNLNAADSTMEDGETVELSFDLSNLGTSGNFIGLLDISASLNVGGIASIPLTTTAGFFSLDPQESQTFTWDVLLSQGETAFVPGQYTLEVELDDTFAITETDETNNSASIPFTILPPGGNQVVTPASGSDFDGNGADDILFFNAGDRSVGQFSMPDGSWGFIGRAGTGWEAVGLGRFDNDDTSADILWFNESTGGVGRFDMDGGTVDRWDGIGFAGAGWDAVGAGDFNGDGVDDILWFNEASGSAGQFRMIDTKPAWVGVGSTGSGWNVAGIADFNGDGTDDILWDNASTGALGQFRMSASGKEWSSIARMASGWEVMDTGDFAGDTFADILVFNEATRQVGYYAVYEDAGQEEVDWISLGVAGQGWSVQGTGDFNGDGVDDILWRHDDGRMGQFEMQGNNTGYDWQTLSSAGTDWEVLL